MRSVICESIDFMSESRNNIKYLIDAFNRGLFTTKTIFQPFLPAWLLIYFLLFGCVNVKYNYMDILYTRLVLIQKPTDIR